MGACGSGSGNKEGKGTQEEERVPYEGFSRIEVFVKAAYVCETKSFDDTVRGDCPFCHRVLLTIAELGLDRVRDGVKVNTR